MMSLIIRIASLSDLELIVQELAQNLDHLKQVPYLRHLGLR